MLARKDEYLNHPLFKILELYTEELQDYIVAKTKRHEIMREAGEKMNLGPDAHYNPVTCMYFRSSQHDPFRMLYKSQLSSVSRPNTFMTSKILANAPILSVSEL